MHPQATEPRKAANAKINNQNTCLGHWLGAGLARLGLGNSLAINELQVAYYLVFILFTCLVRLGCFLGAVLFIFM